jgi:hypothetical protein
LKEPSAFNFMDNLKMKTLGLFETS